MSYLLLVVLIILISSSAKISFARVTPEDILNEQRANYHQKVKNYSSQNTQKLVQYQQKIADFNKQKTDLLGELLDQQGQILEEYIRRTGEDPRYQTDGINRNLGNDIENARYWLTYAHEAVAYQAAKVYITNLTSESNINRDINSTISQMAADLNGLRSKVLKSQNIISELIE